MSIPYLPFSFSPLPLLLCETVRNLLKHCPIGPSNSSISSWKQLPWNLWHWSVSDIDHRQTSARCACSRCGTFLFAPSLVIVLWPQISGKDSTSSTWCKPLPFLPFSHLLDRKDSRSGSLFSSFPHTASLFNSLYHGKAENAVSCDLSVQYNQKPNQT